MSELKMPTEDERAATANVLRNIANLIKSGLYFGSNAGYVQEALGFLETTAKNMAPAPESKPDLKVAEDGQAEE